VELAYKPDAECPQWRKFLVDIFLNDKELLGFMQKAVGYALSGSMKEQCIFMLYGTGMNGKSTFLKHIYRVFGDYAMSTPASTLVEKYGEVIPNDIARLNGARLVTAVESGKNKALAESQIKQLTGDDPISARFLHHEYFDFFATFKIFFATNYKPNISGTDKGIWRRIRTVPFEKVITPEEQDAFLDEKLRREYEGILAWAVAGFSRWQEEGLGDATKIREATNEYREESDLIGNFIKEQCVIGKDYRVSATVILKSLHQWARDNSARFVRRNEFIDYMNREGFVRVRLSNSVDKGKYYWTGIGLKDAEPRSTQSGEVSGEVSQNQNFTLYENFTPDGNRTTDDRPF
jgi:putative DNA primase/helicase